MAKGLDTFGEKASDFFYSLKPEFSLPEHIEFLLPYESKNVRNIIEQFYIKFYNDNKKRIFILGINPGRFGAGTTGIAFTDPIKLESECGIKNDLDKKPELSSTFIYKMIEKAGGPEYFYKQFFLTAICPVGFTKNGKNINYYDDKDLLKSTRDFTITTLRKQMNFGAHSKVAICLGEGKNYNYLTKLNDELKLFEEIYPLAHPRFILQYKRKKLDEYIEQYLATFEKAVKKTLT